MSLTNAGLNPGSAHAAGDPSARKLHLVALAVGLLWLLFWYRDTFMAMVSIWDRSETFAHGFVIAPISAWLVWRRRHFIHNLPIEPSLFGVVVGLGAGFAWLLGELASVDAVSQFAFVGMLVGFVWAVMGTAVVRTYAFPIGFLFFMVPFGEFMFPTMMDWTANFIIWAVRASGVPVYAEGYNLVIPSGRWQVVEGCSGVRYLMASVVVGSLYAYLNYRSTQKRLIFVAASIIVPIFANWLRAYGIVMLGHLSNNKLAAGADHLIYGWVFFGIIIMVLFWIGSRWQEAEEEAPAAPAAVAGVPAKETSLSSRGAMLATAVVAVGLWVPVLAMLDRQLEHGPVQFGTLASNAGWQSADTSVLPPWSPSYSGMRGEQRTAWQRDGRTVGLYIGYYRDQKPGEELINSENRVLISKDPVWKRTGWAKPTVRVGAEAHQWDSLDMASDEHGRMLVMNAYWIGGRWTTNDYLAKIYLVLARLIGEGDDSAAVMVYSPYSGEEREAAVETVERFLAEMGDSLVTMLDDTARR
ncbi:MAG: exosortase A [Pseudomonadaceae bacterium]